MRFLILIFVLLTSLASNATPIQSTLGHFYWGLGQNLGMLGNIRLGAGNIEFGLLQGSGIGVVVVNRTASRLFYQIGPIQTSAGFGMIGGGGLEWETASFFRFRTDVTVCTDKDFQTQSYVSVGGVFIL